MSKSPVLVLALVVAAFAAQAQEEELTPAENAELAPPVADWDGQVGAGFLATDGNAQSRSVNGRIHLEYKRKRWKNTFDASAVNTSAGTGTTAERYMGSDKIDYLFYEKNYAFVVAEYEKDLFGANRERRSGVLGIGRHFLTGPRHVLDLEAGVGARELEENTTGIRRSGTIARGSGKYEWKFTEKNSFLQTLKTEGGSDNTLSESVSQLKLLVIGNLSSTFSYTLRHNSNAPPGRERIDTESAINLVYDFGKD